MSSRTLISAAVASVLLSATCAAHAMPLGEGDTHSGTVAPPAQSTQSWAAARDASLASHSGILLHPYGEGDFYTGSAADPHSARAARSATAAHPYGDGDYLSRK